jgi:hypothetical protein
MSKRKQNIIALSLFGILSLSALIGASYLLYWQYAGTPTTATVTYCKEWRRSEVCYGVWYVDGKAISGRIENADSDDTGKSIEVQAMGDSALKPVLRIPIVLYFLGFIFSGMAWLWWKNEMKK